jgi:hypothetical protein
LYHEVVECTFCIRTFIHSGIRPQDVIKVNCFFIRPISGYACSELHPGLTQKLSQETECIQKQCTKMTFPTPSNSRALDEAKVDSLDVRREAFTKSMLNENKVLRATSLHFDFSRRVCILHQLLKRIDMDEKFFHIVLLKNVHASFYYALGVII